jgi:hypothetical protein
MLGADYPDIRKFKIKHNPEFIIIIVCCLTFCDRYLLPNFWNALDYSVWWCLGDL